MTTQDGDIAGKRGKADKVRKPILWGGRQGKGQGGENSAHRCPKKVPPPCVVAGFLGEGESDVSVWERAGRRANNEFLDSHAFDRNCLTHS